ncbi:MAG: NifB/NifX family molybdenum-iron cluster-binding protein [Thermodesulfobacteriota bacterium]
MRIAIPTNNPGGMEATRSDHFGHCDVFTVINLDQEKKVSSIETVSNVDHDAGGCMIPVKVLADANVNAIVVGGMGARPMQGFVEVGIDVYYADRNMYQNVGGVVDAWVDGMLPLMRGDQACNGGSNCHH